MPSVRRRSPGVLGKGTSGTVRACPDDSRRVRKTFRSHVSPGAIAREFEAMCAAHAACGGEFVVRPVSLDPDGASIVMERCDMSLRHCIRRGLLRCSDTVNVAEQVLGVLAILQRELAFKHHDLHTDNVFVRRSTPSTRRLTVASDLVVEPATFQAILIDFGYVSYSPGGRISEGDPRVDGRLREHHLEPAPARVAVVQSWASKNRMNAGDMEWGLFSNRYDPAYDVLYFLDSLVTECGRACPRVLLHLLMELRGGGESMTEPDTGRPSWFYHSDTTAERALRRLRELGEEMDL
jgi:hypothetical protein